MKENYEWREIEDPDHVADVLFQLRVAGCSEIGTLAENLEGIRRGFGLLKKPQAPRVWLGRTGKRFVFEAIILASPGAIGTYLARWSFKDDFGERLSLAGDYEKVQSASFLYEKYNRLERGCGYPARETPGSVRELMREVPLK